VEGSIDGPLFPGFNIVRLLYDTLDNIVTSQDLKWHICLRRRNVLLQLCIHFNIKKNSGALVRKRTIPTERPPLVGEVSANFCG
jgi:hypothetical protein